MASEDTVKFFLASSIDEFASVRDELGCFFSKVNNSLIKRGLYAKLVMCEDLSSAMADGRKQDVYNEEIRSSDFCYVLLRQKVGAYTIEEFEVALHCMRKSGQPRIRVLFQDCGESSEEVLGFKKQLENNLDCPYETFSSIGEVGRCMLLDVAETFSL